MSEDIYKENILDHYRNPHNFGELKDCDVYCKQYNPSCGDEIEVFVKLDENNCIKEARFKGKGCAISQAASSMLTEKIKGMHVDELKKMPKEEVLEMLGVPIGAARMKCALLSLRTLQKGIIIREDKDGTYDKRSACCCRRQ